MHKRETVCDNQELYHISNVDIIVWENKVGDIQIQMVDKTGDNNFTSDITNLKVSNSPAFMLSHQSDTFLGRPLSTPPRAKAWFDKLLEVNNL
mgnify:CR=1 FL=1|tara:strand:- start:1574 stop:1852 length:279 start_codon:yes stop_codon:yes gene_type:complete